MSSANLTQQNLGNREMERMNMSHDLTCEEMKNILKIVSWWVEEVVKLECLKKYIQLTWEQIAK